MQDLGPDLLHIKLVLEVQLVDPDNPEPTVARGIDQELTLVYRSVERCASLVSTEGAAIR